MNSFRFSCGGIPSRPRMWFPRWSSSWATLTLSMLTFTLFTGPQHSRWALELLRIDRSVRIIFQIIKESRIFNMGSRFNLLCFISVREGADPSGWRWKPDCLLCFISVREVTDSSGWRWKPDCLLCFISVREVTDSSGWGRKPYCLLCFISVREVTDSSGWGWKPYCLLCFISVRKGTDSSGWGWKPYCLLCFISVREGTDSSGWRWKPYCLLCFISVREGANSSGWGWKPDHCCHRLSRHLEGREHFKYVIKSYWSEINSISESLANECCCH